MTETIAFEVTRMSAEIYFRTEFSASYRAGTRTGYHLSPESTWAREGYLLPYFHWTPMIGGGDSCALGADGKDKDVQRAP